MPGSSHLALALAPRLIPTLCSWIRCLQLDRLCMPCAVPVLTRSKCWQQLSRYGELGQWDNWMGIPAIVLENTLFSPAERGGGGGGHQAHGGWGGQSQLRALIPAGAARCRGCGSGSSAGSSAGGDAGPPGHSVTTGMCIPKNLCLLVVNKIVITKKPLFSPCDREVYPNNPLCSFKDVSQ